MLETKTIDVYLTDTPFGEKAEFCEGGKVIADSYMRSVLYEMRRIKKFYKQEYGEKVVFEVH